jgi:hypothetical protein
MLQQVSLNCPLHAVSGAVSNLQTSNPDDSTLVFTWGPPANPNGVILYYFISIINLRDSSVVRQENTANTSITQTSLGMCMYACIQVCLNVYPVSGGPYNVSIAAVNGAGIGQLTAFVNFTQELGMSYCACVLIKASNYLYHCHSSRHTS